MCACSCFKLSVSLTTSTFKDSLICDCFFIAYWTNAIWCLWQNNSHWEGKSAIALQCNLFRQFGFVYVYRQLMGVLGWHAPTCKTEYPTKSNPAALVGSSDITLVETIKYFYFKPFHFRLWYNSTKTFVSWSHVAWQTIFLEVLHH